MRAHRRERGGGGGHDQMGAKARGFMGGLPLQPNRTAKHRGARNADQRRKREVHA